MKLITVLVCGTGALAFANPTKRKSGLQWFGSNESGAEFGSTIPGTLGKDYTWPDTNAIDLLIADGMNLFRIPFLMERLSPNAVDGEFSQVYLQDLISTATHITGQGAWAAIDPHNYGRYNNTILEPELFQTFWANVAKHFADDDHVIFDTNNEYHDMDNSLVVQLNQAAINGIRSAGATSQYIFAEGNAWTGAWTWVDNNDDMKSLTDPENKIIFEMHQYFNSDGSSSSTCLSPTIGQERLVSATEWLRNNSKLGVIGEFSGYADVTCQEAVANFAQYLIENSDVWTGALWWAAGPWWGTSTYSYEPPAGTAYTIYKPILQPYFPVSPSNPQSTTTSQPTSTSSPQLTTTSQPTSTSSPQLTTTSQPTSSSTPGSGSCAAKWAQCGGRGWTGAACCKSGTTCKFQNDWYSQCL